MIFAFVAGWLFAADRVAWAYVAIALAFATHDWSGPVENVAWVFDHLT